MGLRAPSLAEAEAADAELCRQLNLLTSTGVSLDKAIHEVVMVRNSLHMWLQPRAISVGGKKGKGKGKLGQSPLCPCFQERRQGRWQARIRTARQTGKCHAFQKGKCQRENCKFVHECAQTPWDMCAVPYLLTCLPMRAKEHGSLLMRETEHCWSHYSTIWRWKT